MQAEQSGAEAPNDVTQTENSGVVVESSTNPVEPQQETVSEPAAEAPSNDEPTKDDHSSEEGESEERSDRHRPSGYRRQKALAEQYKAEAEAAKARLAELEKGSSKPAADVKALADDEPKKEDYESVLDWLEAKDQWRDKRLEKRILEKQQQEQRQAAEADLLAKRQANFNEKAQPLLEKNPDFFDRLDAYIDEGLVSSNVESAVLESEMGPEVALYLVKNPKALELMRDFDKANTYKAITNLEHFLKNQPEKAAVRQTQAAAPISPVGGSAKTTTPSTLEQVGDMSQYEYEKMRGFR